MQWWCTFRFRDCGKLAVTIWECLLFTLLGTLICWWISFTWKSSPVSNQRKYTCSCIQIQGSNCQLWTFTVLLNDRTLSFEYFSVTLLYSIIFLQFNAIIAEDLDVTAICKLRHSPSLFIPMCSHCSNLYILLSIQWTMLERFYLLALPLSRL